MWEREAEYREDLEQVIQKAATTRLERLAAMAVEDERTCYKHVAVLLEKQYRKCGANMRGKLHLLYCISALLRHSCKQQGPRDRYAERLKPLVSALVTETRPEFAAQNDKLLKLWRMEGVFSGEQLVEVESGRAAQALRLPGLQSKSPSGSLTEASGQDQHVGFGDATGSGRSSAIQSYPRPGGGRGQPFPGGSLQPFQQAPAAESSQDPYSADSNPNGARLQPQPLPPPLPPPPPPPLIPPGLLGPVGPSAGLMAQTQAVAAAAAGLFPQTQMGGFLGGPPAALMQQAQFLGPLGPFGPGGICGGLPGAMGGGMPGGVGVGMGSVLAGGMGPGLPFQGPAGPLPPGLGLQCPPMFPPQSMFNNSNQMQGPGQGQGPRGGHYSRFNNAHGRMAQGLGLGPGSGLGLNQGPGLYNQPPGHSNQGPGHTNQGPGLYNQGPGHSNQPPGHSNQGSGHSNQPPGHSNQGSGHPNQPPGHSNQGSGHSNQGSGHSNQGPGHGWPARFMHDGPMPPGLGPRPTPPQADGRSSAAVSGKGGSGAESGTAPTAPSSDAAGGSGSGSSGGSAVAGREPAGHAARTGSRRSRWELERDSEDGGGGAAAGTADTGRPAGEPVPKRPAWAFQGTGGAARATNAAPAGTLPPPPPLPSVATQEPAPATEHGAADSAPEAALDNAAAISVAVELGSIGEAVANQQQHSQPAPQPLSITCAAEDSNPRFSSSIVVGGDDGDRQALPSLAAAPADMAEQAAAICSAGNEARASLEAPSCGEPMQADAADTAAVELGSRNSAGSGPPVGTAAEGMETEDGGSSSAEVVCCAEGQQQQYSTAPSSPGHAFGARGELEEPQSGAGAAHEGQQGLGQGQDEQARQPCGSGAEGHREDGMAPAIAAEAPCGMEAVQGQGQAAIRAEEGGAGGAAVQEPLAQITQVTEERAGAPDGAHQGMQSDEEPTTTPNEQQAQQQAQPQAQEQAQQQAQQQAQEQAQEQASSEGPSVEEPPMGEAGAQGAEQPGGDVAEVTPSGEGIVAGDSAAAGDSMAAEEDTTADADGLAVSGEAETMGVSTLAAGSAEQGAEPATLLVAADAALPPADAAAQEAVETHPTEPACAAPPPEAAGAVCDPGAAAPDAPTQLQEPPAESPVSDDALPAAVAAAEVQISQPEAEQELSPAATSPSAAPQPPQHASAAEEASEASAVVVTAVALTTAGETEPSFLPDAVQPQQPAEPPPPVVAEEVLVQLPTVAVVAVQPLSSSLILSYDDSRVPLKLEELELGELDDTWL